MAHASRRRVCCLISALTVTVPDLLHELGQCQIGASRMIIGWVHPKPKQDSSAHLSSFLPCKGVNEPCDFLLRRYFFTASRTVSLAPPTAFCTFPAAFS